MAAGFPELDLAVRIAHWRKFKGMSRQDLADKVGVTVAAVYQWEGTGDSLTVPSMPHLIKIVEAFGITMERFYGRLPKIRSEAKAS